MEKSKTSLKFVDVSYKDILKNISFSLPNNEDLIIYTSNDDIAFALKKILILKDKHYHGLIKIGNSVLSKKNKDFLIPDKVLSFFWNKNKKHYHDKLLFQVLKFALKSNDYLLNIQQDFRKDWKEVSEEFKFLILEREMQLSNDLLVEQEEICINFSEEPIIQKIINNNTLLYGVNSEDIINSYVDKRIEMLNNSLNTLTSFELKKLNNYFFYQKKYRERAENTVILKEEYEKIKKEYNNLENTSEFQIAFNDKQKNIQNQKNNLKKVNFALKNGIINYDIYKALKNKLKNKIKISKKEIKFSKKTSTKKQALLNFFIKRKTYLFFKQHKKILLFLNEKDIINLYKELHEYEHKIFSDIYFWLSQEKKHPNFIKFKLLLNKFEFPIEKYEKKSFNKIEELKIEKKNIITDLNEIFEKKVTGSKQIDDFIKNKTKNSFWEKKAEYFWYKEKQKEKIDKQFSSFKKNNKILEINLINRLIKFNNIDNLIYQICKKTKNEKFKIELENKLQELTNLSHVADKIYKPSTYLYTKDLEENDHIFDVLLKNVIHNFLKNENIDFKKLWKPYKDLTVEEKIKIDIGKMSLFQPLIILINLNKTFFSQEEIKNIIAKKNPNTSLIIISSKKIDFPFENYLFIEKGKIIEQNFKIKDQKFYSKYAKNFIETSNFDKELIKNITDLDYMEIFEERQNISLGINKNIYISHNELAMEKLESQFKEETAEFWEDTNIDFINIPDTVIIDLNTKNKKERVNKNGKNNKS